MKVFCSCIRVKTLLKYNILINFILWIKKKSIPLFLSFTKKKSHLHLSYFKTTTKISYVGFSDLFLSYQVSHIQIGKPKPSYLLISSLFLGLLIQFIYPLSFFHKQNKTNSSCNISIWRKILPATYQFLNLDPIIFQHF